MTAGRRGECSRSNRLTIFDGLFTLTLTLEALSVPVPAADVFELCRSISFEPCLSLLDSPTLIEFEFGIEKSSKGDVPTRSSRGDGVRGSNPSNLRRDWKEPR